MRIIGPKHKPWEPRPYQAAGVHHLIHHNSAALFYDPGLGKTSTTLAAFKTLQEHGVAHRALVIAPVRVCQLVWEQEAAQWSQFRDLRFANMASKSAQTRKNQLLANADIWLINPESVPWLAAQFQFQSLPFDTLIIDELTKFKNSRAKRAKQLQPLADKVQRKWGLTGTPAPNGYEDLFGQMKILDGGAALGQYITQYRDRYFTRGRDGFKYVLRPGADKLIQDRLRPYVHALRAEDYLDLPPLVDHEIAVQLPPEIMAQYRQLKKQMVLDLHDGSVTAVNAAALYTKLTQFTGGAIYTSDGAWSQVHDAKIEALEDLIEELSGQQLLVAYHYGHELERLLAKFPHAKYIGSGVSEKAVKEIEDEWNSGRLKLLFGHPASMGHGLNMQKSGASHVAWFTQTWDYELYDQFIKRILRGGTTATRITNHRLVVVDTIDKTIGDVVVSKSDEQNALLNALKEEFIKDDPASARVFATGESEVRRIALPGQPAEDTRPAAAPQAPPAAAVAWGRPPQAETAPASAEPPAASAPTGWNRVAPTNTQAAAQADKVAGPATVPLAQAAQQGNWAQRFTPDAESGTASVPLAQQIMDRAIEKHEAKQAELGVDPALAAAGSFAELERIQSQVIQPGALDPRFTRTGQNISTGGERVEPALPFEGGQPAQTAEAKRTRKPRVNKAQKETTAEPTAPRDLSAPQRATITFDVGSYIAGRVAQGALFEEAYNEAAQIVEGLEG